MRAWAGNIVRFVEPSAIARKAAVSKRQRGPLAPHVLHRHASSLRNFAQPRANSLDLESAEAAFEREYAELRSLSTLINQTSSRGLRELRDVESMLPIYNFLKDRGALTKPGLRLVTNALSQSARDVTHLFRRLPTRDKQQSMNHVFMRLSEAAGTIADDIQLERIPRDIPALSNLLSMFEITAPQQGVALYGRLGVPELLGAVIPSLIKTGHPLSSIEELFSRLPEKTAWMRAHMTFAYLKYGDAKKAQLMCDSIGETAPPSLAEFVSNAFIGEAPVTIARQWFEKATSAPNHASMVRFLGRTWESTQNVDEQLAIFSRYLKFVRAQDETQFKTVTYQLVMNVLNAHHGASPGRDLSDDITRLAATYSVHPERTVFLNILLTHLSKQFPREKLLILGLFREYPATAPPVSYRVRLNALQSLDFDEKRQLIEHLWSLRRQEQDELEFYDWLALARADNSDHVFLSLWNDEGRPHEDKLGKVLRSW